MVVSLIYELGEQKIINYNYKICGILLHLLLLQNYSRQN